ncbi:AsmA-like C-terminal region-containing protein [Pontiella agarivorans]|uniref:AsmA-like C-terminal region-containing protein n=1 Tax=Pontiella agarivorans TaxID=3038953 RepID=A0ABU5MUJ1_9BACT|nr:AsmA-like C-terminal region-containing protein [Pontiella agarivorans]MDZ8117889.1 AsmA-like C-terminal region-containing protein [Pontiella agarivorans]
MVCHSISKRITGITYRVVTVVVRLLCVVAVLLLCGFVFLRVYGIPAPVLRHIVKRLNQADIPVNIDSVRLTLRGWQAMNVQYYSKNPHDIEPLFRVGEMFLFRRNVLKEDGSGNWKMDVEAHGIYLNPSVEWGIEIPSDSAFRRVEMASLTLAVFSDRIEFSDAEMAWLGVDFHVEGTFIKKNMRPEPRSKTEMNRLKMIREAEFQTVEDQLRSIELLGGADIDAEFFVDARNLGESSLKLSLHAKDLRIRKVDFDELWFEGTFAYPEIIMKRVALERNGQVLSAGAAYNLVSKMVHGEIENNITTSKLLLLTPQPVLDLLVKAQLQLEELPEFRLHVEPAPFSGVLNALHGSFSINDITYAGLLIEAARGDFRRKNDRLEITGIQAAVGGQEKRAAAVGSCLQGGGVSGNVYWDAHRNRFDVEAKGSIDPNLLLQPLAMVRIATNVIDRFYFPDGCPEISLELGADYTDWKTFYMDIHGVGRNAGFEEALISQINISAFYSNAVLTLDPIAAMDGVDFLKGSAAVNFRQDSVTFDAFGSMNPELIEQAVYPQAGLFGRHLKTSGDTKIKAKGMLEWQTMQMTDFEAEIEVERLDIPIVAGLDHVSATVIGDGPHITVTNAAYEVYGGKGNGTFSIELDPAQTNLPYTVDVDLDRIDYKQMLQYIGKKCGERTVGKLSAEVSMTAELKQHILASASGGGHVGLEDGELGDVPVFKGFSKVMRVVVPGFKFFSITRFSMDFTLDNGQVWTENALFSGDVFHASAKGTYGLADGYNANVQVNMLADKGLSKVIRVITSPLSRLFELRLTGPLDDPSWSLKNFNPAMGHSGKQTSERSE